MSKSSRTEALRLLGMMCENLPTQASSNRIGAVEAFELALRGISVEAIILTIEAVMSNRQAGYDGKWRPTPPQLSEWCREREDLMRRSKLPASAQPQFVRYPIGGTPPDGYVGLVEYDEKARAAADGRRDRIAGVIVPKLQGMTK